MNVGSSKPQTQWLEWMAVRYKCIIQHAENTGDVYMYVQLIFIQHAENTGGVYMYV